MQSTINNLPWGWEDEIMSLIMCFCFLLKVLIELEKERRRKKDLLGKHSHKYIIQYTHNICIYYICLSCISSPVSLWCFVIVLNVCIYHPNCTKWDRTVLWNPINHHLQIGFISAPLHPSWPSTCDSYGSYTVHVKRVWWLQMNYHSIC